MTATVCLNMIVKNEARVIERCLSAALPFIDTWAIVDTGSTDGTQDLIRRILKDKPGTLCERPWKNFGHNRSEAISLAEGKADFILLCDADMTLKINDPSWRPDLARDGYYVRQHRYARFFSNIRLVNGRFTGAKRWCYRGATHEFIDSVRSELNTDIATTNAIAFWDHADGGSKADKYERDAKLLEQELRDLETPQAANALGDTEHSQNDPALLAKLKARATFYLAQTYRDMETEPQKALDHYQRRAAMGGWDEEAWYAMYQAALLLEKRDEPQDVITQAFLKAYQFRPSRAEPLVALASFHRHRQEYAMAHLYAQRAVLMPEPDDILFIERPVYAWQRYDEFAVASYWLGHFKACAETCEKLLASGQLPELHRERITSNLELARAKMPMATV